ncbi:NAD(P)-dependent dehydrogenase (short-subunit alcohol dehydrogenase family) [Paraburkholderia sp. GAS199]|uniref:SDR family NAD(P)-dependent oxidoreductase n=1 Tax=Paraburkholderia sp. GAS199 TaxID=3035126 RepID=UPI003D1F8906
MQDIIDSFGSRLFECKHVIVSGGSSGIGLAIARGFAALGAQVIATGTSAAKLDLASSDPSNAGMQFATLDVRDRTAVQRFMAAQPRIDVLVNGQGVARPDEEWSEETFLDVMDINLSSAFRLTMAALPKLESTRGTVVNIASMLSYLADGAVPAYTASKTGVVGLTRALAHRFGPSGVRVNAVAPGYHRTEMTRRLWEDPQTEASIAGRSALKRWGTADDLIGATVFLCTPAATFITGAVLPVDGGYHTG